MREGVAAAMPFILLVFRFLCLQILPNSYYLVYLQAKTNILRNRKEQL